MRVLVINTSKAQQKLAAFYLHHVYGHTVDTAEDGMTGIDMALDTNPDAIILDADMPGLSGKDTLKVLKKIKHFQSTPVIMVGAPQDDSAIKTFTAMGAAGFISKHQEMSEVNDKLVNLYGLCVQTA